MARKKRIRPEGDRAKAHPAAELLKECARSGPAAVRHRDDGAGEADVDEDALGIHGPPRGSWWKRLYVSAACRILDSCAKRGKRWRLGRRLSPCALRRQRWSTVLDRQWRS